MQRAFLARGLAHRPVELELQDPREEVPRVRDVRRDVVLGARIEVLFRARDRRRYALVPGAQRPPGLVVVRGRRLPAEHVPAPLVDQLAEGKERDLGERVLHLEVDHRLLIALDRRDEPQLLEVSRRHREHQRVADGLVEAVVRSALIEEPQLVIGMEVVVVPELVVDGGEVLLGGRVADAHLDPQVVGEGDVPGAGVADHVAVAGLGDHRPLPERLRERIEPHRGEERLAGLHHPRRVPLLRGEGTAHVEVGDSLVRLDQRIDVGPLLRPHVAEQVRRDRLAVGDLVLAVGLLELRADIAMQVVVERLHLLPETVGLLLELLGRHVVTCAPHVAHIGEAGAARALVLELHEPLVALALRPGRVVPGPPGIEQLVVVVAAVDDLREVLEVAALRVLGGAVIALQPRAQRGQLLPLRRIVDDEAPDPQQVEHPGGVRIERHVLELRRGLRGVAGVRQHALVGDGGVPLGVVGDVRALDPLRRRRLDRQVLEVLVHLRHELPRVGRGRLLHLGAAGGWRRLPGGGGRARDERAGSEHEGVLHGGAGYLNSVSKRQRSRAPRQSC